MAATARKQYDHRIRQAIVETGDPDLFPKLAIPDSTRRSRVTRGVAEVVTLDARDTEIVELHVTVARLEKKVAILTAVVGLLAALVRVAGITLQRPGSRRPPRSGASCAPSPGRSPRSREPPRSGSSVSRRPACANGPGASCGSAASTTLLRLGSVPVR